MLHFMANQPVEMKTDAPPASNCLPKCRFCGGQIVLSYGEWECLQCSRPASAMKLSEVKRLNGELSRRHVPLEKRNIAGVMR